jgi:hypothetical protein
MNSRLGPLMAVLLLGLLIGVPALAQVPSAANSYYIPQAGSVGAPVEGLAATRNFHACPNNDAGSMPNNARIKVVLRDGSNVPIVGLSRYSIYVHFNGGTDTQGFEGDGADSIIANGLNNTDPPCPLLQYLYADAPTDASGETYITFKGADSTNPGVAVRDPNRKWGHYDSSIPVFANGVSLQGRLSAAGTNGEYVLRIKNVDIKNGLANGNNQGERISSVDHNTFKNSVGDPPDKLSYWRDLDSDGSLNLTDVNIVTAHMDHDCGYPNSP